MSLTKWFGQRESFSEEPDYFVYDDLPSEFRYKILYMVRDAFTYLGSDELSIRSFFDLQYESLRHQLLRAFGRPDVGGTGGSPQSQVESFLQQCSPQEFFIVVEVFLNHLTIGASLRDWFVARKARQLLPKVIQDFNKLALWHKVGYEIVDIGEGASPQAPPHQIIRRDTQYLHVETIRRPLTLLQTAGFEQAQKQFVQALDEYAKGNYADAITDANSSFESVTKQILGTDKGQAVDLIKELQKQKYIPPYMEKDTHMISDLLETLPKLRNKESDAHGHLNIEEEQLPRYAKFAIHLCGTYIVFLVDEFQRRKESSS